MTTLIVGGSGRIGRILARLLVDACKQTRALVRRPDPELEALGAEVVLGDLELGIADAIRGTDEVVFTAGSGGHTGADKTILVDLWGAMKAIDDAKKAGVAHFVMVSSRGAEDPDRSPPALKHYAVCKKIADDYLIRSGIRYTILRPGRLTDDPATGGIRTTLPEDPAEQWISRSDVAHAIAYCLDNASTRDRIYPLVHGEQPIAEALL